MCRRRCLRNIKFAPALGIHGTSRRLSRIKQRIDAVARNVEIDVAVVIIIHKRNAQIHASVRRVDLDSRSFAHVFELAILLVVQQQHTVLQRHSQVQRDVVVIVTRRCKPIAVHDDRDQLSE